jgi:hypothetical protein
VTETRERGPDRRFIARLRVAGLGGWLLTLGGSALLAHGLLGLRRVHLERLMGGLQSVWVGAELLVAGVLVLIAAGLLWVSAYPAGPLVARVQRVVAIGLVLLVAVAVVLAKWVEVQA